MWRRVQSIDERLMRRVARTRRPGIDRPLVAVTVAASYSRLWLAIAAGLAMLGGRRGRRAAGRGVLAIAIAATVANGPVKLLVRRRRPSRRWPPSLIAMPRSTSFPSGHSASAFAFAAGVGAEWPALAPALLPLAGAVAYSRTHTGVHYPSDVAAGVAIGIASAGLAGRLGRPCRAAHGAFTGAAVADSGRAATPGAVVESEAAAQAACADQSRYSA